MDLQKDINVSQYKNFIISIVIVGVFGLIIKNIYSGYVKEKTNIANMVEDIKRKNELMERYQNAQQDYENFSQNFFRGDALLFRKYVEKSAQDSGVDITSLKASRSDQGLYWEEVIQLKARAVYKSFSDFLKQIENKTIEVQRINMYRDKDRMQIELDLKGLILKQ